MLCEENQLSYGGQDCVNPERGINTYHRIVEKVSVNTDCKVGSGSHLIFPY